MIDSVTSKVDQSRSHSFAEVRRDPRLNKTEYRTEAERSVLPKSYVQ